MPWPSLSHGVRPNSENVTTVTRLSQAGSRSAKKRANAASNSFIPSECWAGCPAWLSKSPQAVVMTRNPRLALMRRAATSICDTIRSSGNASPSGMYGARVFARSSWSTNVSPTEPNQAPLAAVCMLLIVSNWR